MSVAPARGFRASLQALSANGEIAVIAEIKRRSPSKGDLAPGLDAAELAQRYERGGAACLSVLTDVDFFGGSIEDLKVARTACSLPILRKDFTVSARDVCDARIMGADCVLLIAAALDQLELESFLKLAHAIGFDALVEIHDEAELDRAVAAGADLIGVNQRDLVTFAVDTERAVRMAPQMPPGVIRVAESGITGPADAAELAEAGYHAVLVGEHLVTSGDPERGVVALRSARRP
jgi:indole-3-glycerol phosphate synthase